MTIPELLDLVEYWSEHPPLHEMVAAYLGIKSEPEVKKPIDNSEFIAVLGGVNRG